MFKQLLQKAKEWLHKMGILKGIKSATSLGANITDEMLDRINEWRWWYYGYVEEFHKHYVNYATGDRKQQIKKSLKAAKFVSAEMASLVFSEEVEISVDHTETDKWVEEQLEENNFYVEYGRFLEYAFAMGGMVIKVIPKDFKIGMTENKVELNYVSSNAFLPISWNNNRIWEGLFVEEFTKGREYFTLIESHTWRTEEGSKVYVISNKLYKSQNKSELGILVSLTDLPQTCELEEETTIENIEDPLFIYTKPNTANNFDLHSPLGISIYANAIDTLKALDNAFDSFDREFRLGKKRIIVPAYAVKTVIDPIDNTRKRYFNYDDEVYEAFDFDSRENQKVTDISVEIRAEEHIAGINALLNILSIHIGFTPGSFAFDGAEGLKTATEVVSENSKTFRTKRMHETNVGKGIKETIKAMISVARLYKMNTNLKTDAAITVKFSDSITEDINAETDRAIKLNNAGLKSKKKIMMDLLGLSEIEADEELARIAKENAQVADADVAASLGLNKVKDNPRPKPKDGETKQEFVFRATATLIAEGFPTDQAEAIANEDWDASQGS